MKSKRRENCVSGSGRRKIEKIIARGYKPSRRKTRDQKREGGALC